MNFTDVTNVVLGVLVVALFLAFYRLLRGPTLPDRVTALELSSVIAVGIVLTYSVNRDQAVFMDVGIVVALVAFLGTVAFAYYLEQRGR